MNSEKFIELKVNSEILQTLSKFPRSVENSLGTAYYFEFTISLDYRTQDQREGRFLSESRIVHHEWEFFSR